MAEVINEAMVVVVVISARGPDMTRQHELVIMMVGERFALGSNASMFTCPSTIASIPSRFMGQTLHDLWEDILRRRVI